MPQRFFVFTTFSCVDVTALNIQGTRGWTYLLQLCTALWNTFQDMQRCSNYHHYQLEEKRMKIINDLHEAINLREVPRTALKTACRTMLHMENRFSEKQQ